jgi:hypothetical protein
MVALAKASGDKDLQRILEDPDPEWALLKKDNPYGAKSARVAYADPADNGIALSAQDPAFIMHAYKDGKLLGPVTEEMLARDEGGSVLHAGYDIHWSIAERIYEVPRETMIEKVSRSAGKVIGNWSPAGAIPCEKSLKLLGHPARRTLPARVTMRSIGTISSQASGRRTVQRPSRKGVGPRGPNRETLGSEVKIWSALHGDV